VETLRGVELTSTNRPSGLALSTCFRAAMLRSGKSQCVFLQDKVKVAVLTAEDTCPLKNDFGSFYQFPVVIEAMSHPIPSRTRKLSLSSPMVLHGRPCGRVGRRRIFFEPLDANQGVLFFCACTTVRPARPACRCHRKRVFLPDTGLVVTPALAGFFLMRIKGSFSA
jgi:hypothetical protein